MSVYLEKGNEFVFKMYRTIRKNKLLQEKIIKFKSGI